MSFFARPRPVHAVFALIALGGVYSCASPGVKPVLQTAGGICAWPSQYDAAAVANRVSQGGLPLSPFGRPERGWAIYAPAIEAEIHTACPPDTPGFAAGLAFWQAHNGLTPHGAVDPPTLMALKAAWQSRRPFLALRAKDICPDPPPEANLVAVPPEQVDKPDPVMLRPRALAALQRMVADARAAMPEAAAHPEWFKVFSGYRSPAYDAARCETEGNCGGIARAACSAHRTGLAVDLDLGAAPGFAVDSSADPNRLFQTRAPAYQWLVRNARRYGFVNYVYEPWHWEWTGEAP